VQNDFYFLCGVEAAERPLFLLGSGREMSVKFTDYLSIQFVCIREIRGYTRSSSRISINLYNE